MEKVFLKIVKNLHGDIQVLFNSTFYTDGELNATIIDGEFSGLSGVTGTITIPAEITQIGDNSFSDCSSISEVIFENTINKPSQLAVLGDYAFFRCTNMACNVEIPNTVTKIGKKCFSESGITGVKLPNNISSDNLGIETFLDCSNLTGKVEFPSTVLEVPERMFANTKITELKFNATTNNGIKQGVTIIKQSAFRNCSSLNKITCSESTDSQKLSFPTTLKEIAYAAFFNCYSLTEIYFPNSLESVGDSSFYYCRLITTISWSNSLKTIGPAAFRNNFALMTFPDINQNSIEVIGAEAFRHCSKFGSVNNGGFELDIIEWINNSKLKKIDRGAFRETHVTGTITSLPLKNKYNVDIEMIGNPFEETDVIRVATITPGTTSIAAGEFLGASTITNVTTEGNEKVLRIPNTVTTIGEYAFSGSKAFTKLVIPASVTRIDSHAFESCGALKIVEFDSQSPIRELSYSLFKECAISSITLPPNLNVIGEESLYNMRMKSFNVPSTVTQIKSRAFGWADLESITLNQGLQTIKSEAFIGTEIKEIVIPDSVTELGSRTLGINSLQKAVIGTGITVVPNKCFSNYDETANTYGENPHLTSVEFKGNITKIGEKAFKAQINLTEIKGINWMNVTEIGTQAFYKCGKLSLSGNLNPRCELGEEAFFEAPLINLTK